AYCDLALKKNRPGVHLLDQLHGRDAAFFLAVDDGPGDRRRAAVLRQKRVMDIEAPVRRELENLPRQDAAVSDDDDDVRRPGGQRGQKGRVANFFRRENRRAVLFGDASHGGGRGLLTASYRAVR